VRVGEAGQDRAGAPIDALGLGIAREQLGRGPDGGDATALDDQRGAVVNRAGLVAGDDRRVVDERRRVHRDTLQGRAPRVKPLAGGRRSDEPRALRQGAQLREGHATGVSSSCTGMLATAPVWAGPRGIGSFFRKVPDRLPSGMAYRSSVMVRRDEPRSPPIQFDPISLI